MSDAIALLTEIRDLLKVMANQPKPTQAPSALVASDSDLDGKYGNPVINAKDPRDWTGPPMKGRKFSECPPAYLDLVASRLDYFAQKADAEGKTTSSGKPVAPFNRADAARARGWAKRMRDGTVPTPQMDTQDAGWTPTDDDIPF
jgi:hypothetical protein